MRGLFLVANHKIMSIRKQRGSRKRRLRFLMFELAVNYGRYACPRISLDVFPDIEHGAASGIDDDTAPFRQEFHLRRSNSEGWNNHDVIFLNLIVSVASPRKK